MSFLLIKLLNVYQKYISPILRVVFRGNNYGCRFYPTCSQYCKEAVIKHGAAKGAIKSLKRILRCNPLFKGGIDTIN